MKRKKLRSDMGWSTADKVVVRGHDLNELIGNVSLGDFAFLELTGRLPKKEESVVFNAIAVTLVEHGVTPSAIAARMTYLGAPEALQGAVAAGLLGIGDRFGGPAEQVAQMLQRGFENTAGDDVQRIAADLVSHYKEAGRPVPGLGHPVHRPLDPRTTRLFEVAAANGFSGRYVGLMNAVSEEAARVFKRQLPVNATGAIGAIACEMGFSWQVCRGLAVMARAIGLVGHLQEESVEPMAGEIWARVEDEASEHNRKPN